MKSVYIVFTSMFLAAGTAMADTKSPVHYDLVHAPTA